MSATRPDLSTTKVQDMVVTPAAVTHVSYVARSPANASVYLRLGPRFLTNAATSPSPLFGSTTETPMTVNPLSLYRAWSSAKRGMKLTQLPHHGAQKWTT